MTTVVIGDLHHYVDWVNPFIHKLDQKYRVDEVVFTGDYFDSYNDTAGQAEDTARWLHSSLREAGRIRRVHLMGNHDMPYALETKCPEYLCPGFSDLKKIYIDRILCANDWDRITGAYYTQGWLISHAGFSRELIEHPVLGIPTPETLAMEANLALFTARDGKPVKYYLPGWRMGQSQVGGITWSDWNHEFVMTPGLKQIVGHTNGTYIRTRKRRTCKNYCIDCSGVAVLVIVNGEIVIERTGKKYI